MPGSLHVSLPDELRAYVDRRTSGGRDCATPSESVRALIRQDMEVDAQRRHIYGTLLKSADDIKAGRLYNSEEVEARSKAFLESLDQPGPK